MTFLLLTHNFHIHKTRGGSQCSKMLVKNVLHTIGKKCNVQGAS